MWGGGVLTLLEVAEIVDGTDGLGGGVSGLRGGVKAQFVWNFNQGIDMCLCNWLTFLRTVKEVGSLRFLLHLKWWNRSFLIFTAT